tara:strand:+ start:31 stop:489 length:459 start_codon:yes stop_codon:yes gene_type:complete
MAHYAFINSDNEVVEVITGKDETEDAPEGYADWEEYYESKREGLTCKRTSFNTKHGEHKLGGTPFRGNYGAVGTTYDATNDVFIEPPEYLSWVLDTDKWCYVPPGGYPTDLNHEGDTSLPAKYYMWDESKLEWVLSQTYVYNSETNDWELQE